MLARTPLFILGALALPLTRPIGVWRHEIDVVGGEADSDAGIPVSYVVQRNYHLVLPLRFTEEEWAAVRDLLIAAQLGAVLTWFPDADRAESWDVYLKAPAAGADITPTIFGEYPRLLGLDITVCRVDREPWDGFTFFSDIEAAS